MREKNGYPTVISYEPLGQQAANCNDDDGHDHESPKLILSGYIM